jgi:hypothetical protein
MKREAKDEEGRMKDEVQSKRDRFEGQGFKYEERRMRDEVWTESRFFQGGGKGSSRKNERRSAI